MATKRVTKAQAAAITTGTEVAVAAPVAAQPTKATRSSLRIVQNGVSAPLHQGGMCYQVWAACAAALAASGVAPTAKVIAAQLVPMGHNANNVAIEVSNWRKFNGYAAVRAKKAVAVGQYEGLQAM